MLQTCRCSVKVVPEDPKKGWRGAEQSMKVQSGSEPGESRQVQNLRGVADQPSEVDQCLTRALPCFPRDREASLDRRCESSWSMVASEVKSRARRARGRAGWTKRTGGVLFDCAPSVAARLLIPAAIILDSSSQPIVMLVNSWGRQHPLLRIWLGRGWGGLREELASASRVSSLDSRVQ